MLHELLLALSGVPGDIFADDKAAQRYRIPDEYSFLHDSERSLLEAVAQLGYVYRQIREVLDQWARAGEPELPTQPAHVSKRALKRLQNAATHDFSNMDNALGPPGETVAPMIREKLVPSSYRTALAGAIEEQIMKPYRNLIIENERRLLPPQASDEDAVLTSIAMISHIFSKYQILLPFVYDLISEIGLSPLDYHGTRLLSFLHARSHVGIPQVRETMQSLLSACEEVLLRQLGSWLIYGSNVDPHLDWFVRGTGDEDGGLNQAARTKDTSKWHTEFTLEPSMLPSYVSEQTADAILFIGRAMNTMRTSGVNDSQLEGSISDRLAILGTVGAIHSVQLDATVESIRHDVSLKIWDVVMRVGELEGMLSMFRNVFLLANGRLYTALLDGTSEVVAKAHARKSGITEHDINQLWRKVARQYLSNDDAVVEAFYFRVADRSQGAEQLPYDDMFFGIPLRFGYDLKWPMDLIFTERDMQSYSIIFTFLLALRQSQVLMQNAFRALGRQTAAADLPPALRRRIGHARTAMQHFLDSFLHYAQYDVLESSYAKLLDAVQSQKEFESIQKLHRSFLSSVCSGLFVDAEDYRGVGRTVRTLLELCRKFAGVAERNIRAGSEAAVTAAVDELEEQFWLGMSSIYKTFSGVGSTLRQSLWLDQLVLRLDFNGFLSAQNLDEKRKEEEELVEQLTKTQV